MKLTDGKIWNKHKIKESEIFTIKIPAEPYKYKQGVGFVSENTLGRNDILSALAGLKSDSSKKKPSKIIEIPTKFFGNGKLSVAMNITEPSVTSVTPSTSSSSTTEPETTTPTSQPVMETPETTEQPPEPSTTQTVQQISKPLGSLLYHQSVPSNFIVPASTMLLQRPPAFKFYSRFYHPAPVPTPPLAFNPYQILWRPAVHRYFYG